MGTRGLVGFRLESKDYLAYNHYDSYPSGLGREVVGQLAQLNLETLPGDVQGLALVTDDTPITKDIVERLKAYTELHVSEQSTEDWYCLLHGAQGSLVAYLEIGLMPDNAAFIRDSLFCEWAYIVNLDTVKLEIWRGFQKLPDPNNRYGQEADDSGYYPCTMLAQFPLKSVTAANITGLE